MCCYDGCHNRKDDKIFLRLYNNIIPPSQLPQKANYYLFKVGGAAEACVQKADSFYCRRELSPHGRTKQTSMGGNGVSNYRKTKTEAM